MGPSSRSMCCSPTGSGALNDDLFDLGPTGFWELWWLLIFNFFFIVFFVYFLFVSIFSSSLMMLSV